jgi:glycosyltransferase involved in cell wall biosynthesis
MRVGLDARRPPSTGVGRVMYNLVRLLPQRRPDDTFVILAPQGSAAAAVAGSLENCVLLPSAGGAFTQFDVEELPTIIRSWGVDVFVHDQFYTIPFLETPNVRYVHDTWSLDHSAWLPNIDELRGWFAEESLSVCRSLVSRFKSEWLPVLQSETDGLGDILAGLESRQVSVQVNAACFGLAYLLASRIIVPSESTKRDLIRIAPPFFDRVVAIHHALPSESTIGPARVRTDRVLMVGKLTPRKNVLFGVRAVELLRKRTGRNISLVLVGAGEKFRYARQVDDLLRGSPYRGFATHLSNVSEADLTGLYATSKLVLFPSLQESFGLPALESMSSGTPLLVSDTRVSREVAGRSALFVNPRDLATTVEAMRQVLESRDLRDELSATGLERASRFSPDEWTDAIWSEIVLAQMRGARRWSH